MLGAVIFDLDNTICNTSEAINLALRKTFTNFSSYFLEKSIDELLTLNEKAFLEIYSNLEIPSTSKPLLTWVKFFEYLEIKPSIVDLTKIFLFQKEEILKSLEIKGGINEVISYLKSKNIKIGILTNGSYFDQSQKIIKLGIAHNIDILVTPDLALVHKPDIKIYEYIMSYLNINSENTLMIGNNIYDDIQGAKNVGMHTLLIKSGDYTEEENVTAVDYTITKKDNLLTFLQTLAQNH